MHLVTLYNVVVCWKPACAGRGRWRAMEIFCCTYTAPVSLKTVQHSFESRTNKHMHSFASIFQLEMKARLDVPLPPSPP